MRYGSFVNMKWSTSSISSSFFACHSRRMCVCLCVWNYYSFITLHLIFHTVFIGSVHFVFTSRSRSLLIVLLLLLVRCVLFLSCNLKLVKIPWRKIINFLSMLNSIVSSRSIISICIVNEAEIQNKKLNIFAAF